MTLELFKEAVKSEGWLIIRKNGYIYFKRRDKACVNNQGDILSCHTKDVETAMDTVKGWIVNGFPSAKPGRACAKRRNDGSFIAYLEEFWSVDSLYFKSAEIEGRHLTKAYIEQQRRFIRIYYAEYFKKIMLSQIDENVLNGFFDWVYSYKSKKTGRPLARGSVARLKEGLMQPLKWGRQKGKIKQIIDFTIVCPNISRRPIHNRGILTQEETDALLNPACWDNPKAYIAFMIAVNCGLRVGEIRALRIGSIRPGFLVVSHSFNDTDGLKCTKTGKTRLVPCPDSVLALIASHVAGLPEDEKSPEYFLLTDDLHEGQPLNKGFCIKSFYHAMKVAGIERIRPNALTGETEYICFHSLRHQTATRWVESGLDLRLIAQAMGHGVDMLEHYSDHFNKNDMAALRQKLISTDALGASHKPAIALQ